jgi:alpha-tubulin suppressor-like RCC1 family protein
MRCWGYRLLGRLGVDVDVGVSNGGIPLTEPWQAVFTEREIESISIAALVSCALTTTGGAICWGAWTSGVLGQGDYEGNDVQIADEMPNIDLGESARSLTTSGRHTCAILDSGQVKCWGSNSRGQLGIGSTETAIGDEAGEMGTQLPYVSLDD